jgi:hypothetical protein
MLEDVFKLTEKSMTVFSKHEAVIKSCVYGELFYCFTTFSLGYLMPFSTVFQLYCEGQFYWCMKPEYPEI